jgi:hypothetical protein
VDTNQNQNQRAVLAGRCAESAYRRLLEEGRELWASFSMADVYQTLTSTIQLDYQNWVAQTAPSIDAYLLLYKQVFLEGLDSGAVSRVAPITSLGQAVLTSWRRETNVGAETLPPPERALSPAEALEQQVIQDWNSLPSAEIRKKRDTSKAYAATLARLLETDRLSPHATVKVAY